MRKLKITGLVSALLVFALLFAACAGLQGSRISGGALSVAFNTGDGTGTAPAALAVSHGGIVVLPGIGDMVAPAGDRQLFFAGWDVNGKHFRPGNTVVANENLECTAVWLPYLALEERFHGQINYAAGFPHNHDQAYLRIILPPTGVGPFPVMILVLGGGWNQGNWFPGAAGHWTTRGFGSGGPGAGVNPFLGTNPEFMPNSPGEVLAERDMSPLARGYALVIIGHRGINTNDADLNRAGLGGFAMPNPVLDVMAGIRYIRRNAEKYQLDPNRFALTGQSASGWMATMITILSANPGGSWGGIEWLDMNNYRYKLGELDVSADIHVGFNIYGLSDVGQHTAHCVIWMASPWFTGINDPRCIPTHDEPGGNSARWLGGGTGPDAVGVHDSSLAEILFRSSTLRHVHPNMPPLIVVHAVDDHVVKWQQSQILVDRIREVAGPDKVLFTLYRTGGHTVAYFTRPDQLARHWEFIDRALNVQR